MAVGAEVQAEESAFERHYSIDELATVWGVSDDFVRRLFLHEPGVGVFFKYRPGKRTYPPYGRAVATWVAKARREGRQGTTVVGLLPARTDTAWWQNTVMKAREIRLLRGRIRFVDAASPAPFPSAVVVFKENRPRRIGPRVVAWDWRRDARAHPTRTSCRRAAVSPAVAA